MQGRSGMWNAAVTLMIALHTHGRGIMRTEKRRLKSGTGGLAMANVECGLTEHDVELGWVCPFDDSNETDIKCCEDCCFAKEVD